MEVIGHRSILGEERGISGIRDIGILHHVSRNVGIAGGVHRSRVRVVGFRLIPYAASLRALFEDDDFEVLLLWKCSCSFC